KTAMRDSDLQNHESPADAFQRLWDEGRSPNLAGFLAGAGHVPPSDLAEIVRIDQRQRWLAGKPTSAESYLETFPTLRDDPEMAVDLIFHEYLLREQKGEEPDVAGFQHRFPQHATTLGQQIALHKTLSAGETTKSWAPNGKHDPTSSSEPPQLTGNFGRYRIERLIGQGGMGAVYLAQDSQLHRAVALTVPHSEESDAGRRSERFSGGARIAATFPPPNFCPVYGGGKIAGGHSRTMPYLQGEPLSELLRRNGRLPPAAAVRLAARIARALDVAHQAGVLHR